MAKGLIVWPGGFGTLDELMELLTLIQTRKIKRPLPIVLYGKEFWENVINWDYLVEVGTISPEDLDLFHISDDVNDTFDYVTNFIESNQLKGPNFDKKTLLRFFSLLLAQTEPVKDIHVNPPRVWALTNAMIHTEPGDSLKDATVVIRDGRIDKVGRYIKIPLDAYEIDLEGAHIYPGFIDGWFEVKKDEKTISLMTTGTKK